MGRDIGRGRCRWLKSLKPVTRGTVRPVIIVERAHDNVEAFKITQNLEFVGDILSVLASPCLEQNEGDRCPRSCWSLEYRRRAGIDRLPDQRGDVAEDRKSTRLNSS